MRINTKYQYNSSFRKNLNGYNDVLKNKLIIFLDAIHIKKCEFQNKKFFDIVPKQNDFVYADPPYIITNADYCREGVVDWRWSVDKEKRLLDYLDVLNKNNTRFALSNVLIHKERRNDILIDWSRSYNIYHLNYNYGNFNSQSNKKEIKYSDEVLITNY